MSKNTLYNLNEFIKNNKGISCLIIDVRGNSGGSRKSFAPLLDLLTPPDFQYHISNVVAYRLGDNRDSQYLESRGLFSMEELHRFGYNKKDVLWQLKNFHPEIAFPAEKFSEWHYYLPNISANRTPPIVVVISDSICLSATDIFLNQIKHLPNVKIIGRPSGGGSGAPMIYKLINSGISIRLSSMLSFNEKGNLFDGNGVSPDISIEQKVDSSC